MTRIFEDKDFPRGQQQSNNNSSNTDVLLLQRIQSRNIEADFQRPPELYRIGSEFNRASAIQPVVAHFAGKEKKCAADESSRF